MSELELLLNAKIIALTERVKKLEDALIDLFDKEPQTPFTSDFQEEVDPFTDSFSD